MNESASWLGRAGTDTNVVYRHTGNTNVIGETGAHVRPTDMHPAPPHGLRLVGLRV